MPFGLGKNKGKGDVFVPTDAEREIISTFLEDRNISMMEAKGMIMQNEAIDEVRRGRLADYLREQRAANPKSVEGVFERPGLERK